MSEKSREIVRLHELIRNMDSRISELMHEADNVKEKERLVRGFSRYVLIRKGSEYGPYSTVGHLSRYKYSDDGKWLDIQEEDSLVMIPTENIVQFKVDNAKLINR